MATLKTLAVPLLFVLFPLLTHAGTPSSLLARSVLSLSENWLFKPDPEEVGMKNKWFSPGYDSTDWQPMDAGQSWQNQGFPDHGGYGWYRKKFKLPAHWKNYEVRWEASGIDDEYDLFVNGIRVGHAGGFPISVYSTETRFRIDPYFRPDGDNEISVRVKDWGGGGGLTKRILLRKVVPVNEYQSKLPRPYLEKNPEWIALYYYAWQVASEKVLAGTKRNGFARMYLDAAYNDQLFQWDSSFLSFFTRYAGDVFPVMEALDNFYMKQRPDGFIARVFDEIDGKQGATPPFLKDTLVNPPLFAWAEWEYYRFSGDTSRFARVLPVLERYYGWIRDNLRTPLGQGLYFQEGLSSGMDNLPRGDVNEAGWVDMSMQQASAALYMSKISRVLRDSARERRWNAEFVSLRDLINRKLWSEKDGIYYDLARDGSHGGVRHIGGFWSMVTEIASPAQAARLISHLKNPAEFYRPTLFPALAASEPDYSGNGYYWRGGVWAPTNYVVTMGLKNFGAVEFAREAAENFLSTMWHVYKEPINELRIFPAEKGGSYQTLWECYSPENFAPCTRWDGIFYGRQEFVGWSGLGPISMLIEDVLGIDVIGAENRIEWNLGRKDRHGIENLMLVNGKVDLMAEPLGSGAVKIRVRADRAFELKVRAFGKPAKSFSIPAGKSELKI